MDSVTTRSALGSAIFVAGTVLCGIWAYRWVSAVTAPTGGIGAVSAGLAELVVELLAVVAPLLITFRLTQASGSTRLATAWRTAHVVATIVLVGIIVFDSSGRSRVAAALFFPLQVFLANGALAIRIAVPRHSTPEPT